MTMGGYLDDVLNECLERLTDGDTVEHCLASYPGERAQLEPLLITSAATIEVAETITYRLDAKQRSFYKLTAALADRDRAPKTSRFAWLMDWRSKVVRTAAISLGAAVLISGTAFGASKASEGSVPGEPLYAVKTLKEDISLMMPKSDITKAKEQAHLANVRAEEIGTLIDRGQFKQANELVVRVTYHLNSSAQLVGVTVTTINPMVEPVQTAPRTRERETSELVSFYERDSQLVRGRFERQMARLSPEERQEVYIMMAQWEFMSRMYMQALYYDGPPTWPFWMDQGMVPGR